MLIHAKKKYQHCFAEKLKIWLIHWSVGNANVQHYHNIISVLSVQLCGSDSNFQTTDELLLFTPASHSDKFTRVMNFTTNMQN